MKLKISVPATTANIGPGFDIWGIALNLRNEFICDVLGDKSDMQMTIEADDLVKKTSANDPAQTLAKQSDNLIEQCYKRLFELKDMEAPGIHIHAKLGIPLSRGLGSSSTAVLAGLTLANEIIRKRTGQAFSIDEIFQFACDIEKHPDNVAPALYGGFQLSVKDERDQNYKAITIPVAAPIQLAGIIPHITLSTEEARKVVVQDHSLSTVTYQSARTGLISYLLSTSEWTESEVEFFKIAMNDRVHQNARAALIPGLTDTLKAWVEAGAYGAYLSGAGTTILSFWQDDIQINPEVLQCPFTNSGIAATNIFPKVDKLGLVLEHM